MGFTKRRKQPYLYRPHAAQIENGVRTEGSCGMLGVDPDAGTSRLNTPASRGAESPAPAVQRKTPTRRSQVAKRRGQRGLHPARGFAHPILLILIVLGFAACNAGCSTLYGSATTRAGKAAGKLVSAYCEDLPSELRAAVVYQVNHHATPHSIRVDCAEGIAPPLISTPRPVTP